VLFDGVPVNDAVGRMDRLGVAWPKAMLDRVEVVGGGTSASTVNGAMANDQFFRGRYHGRDECSVDAEPDARHGSISAGCRFMRLSAQISSATIKKRRLQSDRPFERARWTLRRRSSSGMRIFA